MSASSDPEGVDFALDEMPGPVMHDLLRHFRAQGPLAPTRFGVLRM